MYNTGKFYIGGRWVDPASTRTLAVVNPANNEVIDHVALADQSDVARAVAAAKAAFETFGTTTVAERITLLERIAALYERRLNEIAHVISREMGAPISFA